MFYFTLFTSKNILPGDSKIGYRKNYENEASGKTNLPEHINNPIRYTTKDKKNKAPPIANNKDQHR
jgi:hypothetical protein